MSKSSPGIDDRLPCLLRTHLCRGELMVPATVPYSLAAERTLESVASVAAATSAAAGATYSPSSLSKKRQDRRGMGEEVAPRLRHRSHHRHKCSRYRPLYSQIDRDLAPWRRNATSQHAGGLTRGTAPDIDKLCGGRMTPYHCGPMLADP